MAFGLVGASGSFQVNAEMLGGLVTGSGKEFLALPISGTVLGGLSGLTTNEWSRFYLSDSFGAASGSVIQALNYLSASIKTNADGDVAGPGSATDNAIVRFDGATGKLIQNTTGLVASDAGIISSSVGATLGNLILNDDSRSLTLSGTISSSAGATFLGPVIANGALNVSGTLTLGGTFSPSAISGAVKINVFTHKILSNNAIETSASLVAKTTISGAGQISGRDLVTEEAIINTAGAYSGSGLISANALTTEEATINVAGAYSGSGGIAGQSLTVANLYKVTSAGAVSSSLGATLGNLILNNDATSLVLSGSMTGSGLANFSNISLAQGGGYKPALIVSSSAISTAANAAAIPRMVLQGTDHLGNLADFMIAISGGILIATKLTDGTWPV